MYTYTHTHTYIYIYIYIYVYILSIKLPNIITSKNIPITNSQEVIVISH